MASHHNFNPDPGEKIHNFGESVDLMDLIENVASDGSCTTPVYIEYGRSSDVGLAQNVTSSHSELQPHCSSHGSPPEQHNVASKSEQDGDSWVFMSVSKADTVPTSSGYVFSGNFLLILFLQYE